MLDDRASFRRFCGFSCSEPTPKRTIFVRVRKTLVELDLNEAMFDAVNDQLKDRHITVKQGTLIDATIIASVSRAAGRALLQLMFGREATKKFGPNSKRSTSRSARCAVGSRKSSAPEKAPYRISKQHRLERSLSR